MRIAVPHISLPKILLLTNGGNSSSRSLNIWRLPVRLRTRFSTSVSVLAIKSCAEDSAGSNLPDMFCVSALRIFIVKIGSCEWINEGLHRLEIKRPDRHSVCQVFPLSSFYSTILIGSSFFPLNAATLIFAAIFWAISCKAIATGDSGWETTIGLPLSPPMRTF